MIDPQLVWQYLFARFGVDPRRDDRGVVTTEFAVLAFLVVTGAIVVAGIIMATAKRHADSIP